MQKLIASIVALALFGVLVSAASSSMQAPAKQAPAKQAPKETQGTKTPPKSEAAKKDAKDAGKKGPTQDAKKAGADAKKNGEAKGEAKRDAKDDAKRGDESKEKDVVKTRDAEQSEIEIPEGANEEDIRAIRGANAMLETERKLSQVLKKMNVAKGTPFIKFDRLDSWPYEDGYTGMPKDLAKLDKKKVAMAGFMLPIDEVEDIKTFYLVKSLWSCCYGIPPDVNGLVKINVKSKKGIGYQWDPILVVGTFRLKKVMDDDYTICIWQMDDADVRVIEID